MPSDFRRVEEIYFAVSALPAGEREAALAALCGSDDDVRGEVESLLSHDEAAAGFLTTPALGDALATKVLSELAPEADRDELIGQRVGKYKIEARIASGGMGTVYLAVRADEQFDQQVALKVVKRGMDTEEILARFKAERQTLAHLNHENIARVIDGGMTGDGRPYLVMEYVKGEAIDVYCDRKRLGIEERLRLFRAVCEGVRYAHQSLVVHRDLKPGNILVSVEGVPKLLDFGIAKVLTRTRGPDVTAATERRLTPEYASPEQISGAMVTTSSDVYSLGVILYELLTGQRPFDFGGANATRIEQVVLTHEVAKPSTALARRRPRRATSDVDSEAEVLRVAKQLRGDLDTIVLTAIHRDPTRRYSSVEALIGDIDRYFKGLPISAQKDTLRYRVRKFVGRNAVGVSLSATAVLLMAGGVGGIVWQARIAASERDQAIEARDAAEDSAEGMQDAIAAFDPERAGKELRFEDIIGRLENRVETEMRDRPLVQANGLSALGHVYMNLGEATRAEEYFRRSYELRRARLPATHHDIGESKLEQAELEFSRRELERAEVLAREALAIFRTQSRPRSVDTSEALNDLGSILRALGRLDEAEATHREAMSIREEVAGKESRLYAESLNNLANVMRSKGDAERAAEYATQSLAIRRRVLGEEAPMVLQSMQNLAVLMDEAGRFEESTALFEQVLEREPKKFGESNPSHGTTLRNYGTMLMRRGELVEAEKRLRRADEIHRAAWKEADPRRWATTALLGRCLVAQGKWGEGEAMLREATPRLAKGTSRERQDETAARGAWGQALRGLGRSEEAERVERGTIP